jgi:acetyltransferase-like isoleucine patch superfamily enzyme
MEDVVIRGPARIFLGEGVAIEHRVTLDAKSSRGDAIHLDAGVVVRTGSVIDSGYDGYVRVGARSELGPNTQLRGGGGLILGEDVLLASNVGIFSTNHGMEAGSPIIRQLVSEAMTTIENGCWLGANVVVLPGTTVGHGAVIGANSVVTRDIPPNAIAVGAPARVIGKRGS